MTRSKRFCFKTKYGFDTTCGIAVVPFFVLNCGVISSSITSSAIASESADSNWISGDAWGLSSDETDCSWRDDTATELWFQLDGRTSLHPMFVCLAEEYLCCSDVTDIEATCWCVVVLYRLSLPDRLRRNIMLIVWIIQYQSWNFFINERNRSSFG